MRHNKQKGFTLIELLVAMLLMAIILPGIVALFQTMNTSNSKMTKQADAVNQLKNAINYITMDTEMAGSVSCPTGNFPLTLNWVSIEASGPTDQIQVIYTLTNGILTRNYYFDGVLQNTKVVANNVSSSSLVWPYVQSGVTTSDNLQVNLTVSTVSRTFVVHPRVVQTTLVATTTTIGLPTVTGISPNSGTTNGGNSVTITGTNLLGVSAVHFGTTAASTFVNGGATQITVTSPSSSIAGTVDITVTTPGGTSATSSTDKFTYYPPPTVTGISPTSGPTSGNTSVNITGTNFTGATAVNFGTNTATYTINSDTSITATSPSSTIAGIVDVTVTTPGGTSATGSGDQFTYVAVLAVTGISPTSGPASGGTSVIITGTKFTGATGVKFGTNAATYTVNSDTSIRATSPAGSGTVHIQVTTAGGTSPTSSADQFTYQAAPTVTSISPTSGPLAGGTPVTITGTNFIGATAVMFGANPATAYTVNSATQITATSPAGSAGTVDIRVTTTSGTSATGSADKFTYQSAPTVTGISPTLGLIGGGTAVTITGTNFIGATAVMFGTNPATIYTVNSATQITATSPSGSAGIVDITVITPSGTSATGSADKFTYVTSIPLALDGSTSSSFSNGTVTLSLTTTNPNDLLYVSIVESGGYTVKSITSSPSLVWNQRASVSFNSTRTLETWYATWSSMGTIQITITQTNSSSSAATAFGISGANTTSPFDVTSPSSGTGNSGTASTTINVNANDFIIGVLGVQSNPTLTTGTGFTLITTQANGTSREISDEYELVSTAQSNLSVGYSWSGGSQYWAMIADAVKKAPPATTITINTPNDIAYGASSMTLSATLTSGGTGLSGLPISFSVNGGSSVNGTTNASGLATITYSLPKINAGTDTGGISASFAGNNNYSPSNSVANLNVSQRAITVTAVANTKTYDGTTSAATIPTMTGSLATGDTVSWTETYNSDNVGTSVTLTPAGTVSDGNSGNNYTITFVNNTSGVITTRAITVTAVANTKAYDGTTSAAAIPIINAGSLATGDSATWTETYSNGIVGTGKSLTPAGTVGDGNGGNNYTVTFVTVNTGVISTKALTVSGITASNKNYDGTTTATISTSSAVLVGVVGSDNVTLNTGSATGAFASKNAGNSVTVNISGLTISGSSVSNYTLTQPATAANITTRPITVTATTNTKTYDGTTSAAAVPTMTGSLVTGDTATWTETYNTATAGTGKTLTPSGTVSDGNGGNNYTVTFVNNTTGVINKATPTLSVTNSPVTYSGSAQSATVSGSVGGTVSSVKYNGSATVPSAVGTYAITANFTPTDSTDYSSLTGVSAGNFIINKATPTLSVTNSPVTANGSPHSATVSSGSVAGTVSNVKYNGSTTVPSAAGTYTITANFVPTDTTDYNSLTDASAGNFIINNPVPTLTRINPTSGRHGNSYSLTLTGTGFINGVSSVNENGNGITITGTTVTNSTTITINITISSSNYSGSHTFSVTNSTPGGGISGTVAFTVY